MELLQCVSLLLIYCSITFNPTAAQLSRKSTTPKTIPLKFHESHRTVQWCVNGIDEPEFQRYPWNEFSPILQRRYYHHFSANVRFKYSVKMNPIKIKASNLANIGSGQSLLQRAHFVFHAELRREFKYNVRASYNDTIIEGILIQANYAPLGVGLPANVQFVHPKEFNCGDCEKPIGIPIACRKRTYMHSIHPTLLVYHHKMVIPDEERERRRAHCVNKLIPSQCILTGFKDIEENLGLIDDTNVPSSQAKQAEAPAPAPAAPPPPPAPAPAAPPPPPAPAPPSSKTPIFDWDKKSHKGGVDITYFGKYVGRPHPQITDTCQSSHQCNEFFKNWFRSKCCSTGSRYETEGEFCNKLKPPATTTVSPTGVTPAPEPPPKPLPETCPNREIQTPADVEGGEGYNSALYDGSATVYKDPYQQSKNWPVWDCRPHYATVCRPPGFAAKESVPWDTRESLATDYQLYFGTGTTPAALPAVDALNFATQCCIGAAPGETCPPGQPGGYSCKPPPDYQETECIPRIALPYDEVDKIEMISPDVSHCDRLIEDRYFPPASKIHGNLVWYVPPCHYSTRIRFQMLVVHSFSKGIYSIVESEDYYDLRAGAKSGTQNELNDHIPSPLFTGFPHECEAESASPGNLYSTVSTREVPQPFDYSRSYDQCVQETGDDPNHQICIGVPEFEQISIKSSPVIDGSIPKCDKLLDDVTKVKVTPCKEMCPELPDTTIQVPTTPGWKLIKRSLHGGINIVTNFCVMPICVFIARFYKETYNLQTFKGQKTWFWMHMIGSGGSTVFMYMGYFTGMLVNVKDAHVVYGNIYIILLGVSYCTSWMRHKKRLISSIMEATHAACGYGCLILALICVTNAKHNEEPISNAVKLVVYVALASLIIFYVGMTMHICSLDRKFGMKPRRWHFPVVESRFEDLPVPGRKVRQFFLVALLLVNLPLTLISLFL